MFGLFTLAGDFNLTPIIEYCSFLGNFYGRGLFNIYVGCTLWCTAQGYVEFIEWCLWIISIGKFFFLIFSDFDFWRTVDFVRIFGQQRVGQ
jgi:TM2 domain-containing membrane protein YozV